MIFHDWHRVGNWFKPWFKPAEIKWIYAIGWHKLNFTWLKGNNSPSSVFSKTLSIIFTMPTIFHSLFRNTYYFPNMPKLNHGFRKITEGIKASLSEPYSTVWRQPITFKLLRADQPPPRNRRSGTCRPAPNFSAPNSFVVNSNFSQAWVSSAGRITISSCFQHGLQYGYLSLIPHVKGGLFPLNR